MPMKQHLVSCHIHIGGDIGNVVVRDAFRPVTWNEVLILQAIHGQANVHTIEVVAVVDRPRAWDEKQRLYSIYGKDVVDQVYPGNNPTFEWFVPGVEVEEPAPEPAPAPAPEPAAEPAVADTPAADTTKPRRIARGVQPE